MIRRDFLRRLTVTAAGLLVADDALELLLDPPRKVWPGWCPTPGGFPYWHRVLTDEEIGRIFHEFSMGGSVGSIVMEGRCQWHDYVRKGAAS